MSKKEKLIALGVLGAILILAVVLFLHSANIPVLNPKGRVAQQERQLIIIGVLLSIIVVVPVYFMLFLFTWRYRESNSKAKYQPEWDHSRKLETVWWAIPGAIILVLSVITWNSSHALDPYKPLISKNPPITIQVVAMQWKWLFIYPQQNIATVNFVEFPVNTPVNFQITSDAPMNSFWIPALGGQIYAMPGMATQLHLVANQAGSYDGRSANISGKGFSGMHFVAEAAGVGDFSKWLQIAQKSTTSLSFATYGKLSQPSQNEPIKYYSAVTKNMFNAIIDKYMQPGSQLQNGAI